MMGSMLRRGALTADTTGGGPPSPSWTLDFSSGTPSGYTLTRASSGTYVDSSGYVASGAIDFARLTHNSSGSRLGLLVEGQRTNLILQSEDFTTTWTNSNTTEPTTNNTAPDGTATADEIKESAATTSAYNIQQGSISVTNGQAYTFTVYAKANTATVIQLFGASAAFGLNEWANFNISAGTVGSVGTSVTGSDATITSVGSGWYRCKLTMVATATTTASLVIGFTDNNSSAVRAPLYTVTAGNEKSFYLWGAQVEAASTESSYIPTTTASVTRESDIAYLGAVTNFGRPGSFVVEYYKPTEPNGHVLVAQDDVGLGGRLGLAYSSGGPRIIFGTTSAGSGGTDTAGLNKVGWAWDGSGAATRSAINGAAWDTSLATSFDPSTVTSIGLGGNVSDPGTLPITVSEQPNVIVRKITFYNSQLSAADLNTLTT